MVTADTPEFMIEDKVARALISALYAAPHGVIAMSHDIEGLVETSTNLASVKMTEPGKIVVATSQRSSVESEKYDIAYQVECLFRLAGAEPSHGDGYPGWKPNMHSRIKDIAVEAYQELYQQTPAIKAIHAGLECGLFLTKYPQLDMISFGPTLRGVHSPDEMMHINRLPSFLRYGLMIISWQN
jgi:dipeptidase D